MIGDYVDDVAKYSNRDHDKCRNHKFILSIFELLRRAPAAIDNFCALERVVGCGEDNNDCYYEYCECY